MNVTYLYNHITGDGSALPKAPECNAVQNEIKKILQNNLPDTSSQVLTNLAIVLEVGMVNLYFVNGKKFEGRPGQYWDGLYVTDQLSNLLQYHIPYIAKHDLARTSLALEFFLVDLHEDLEREHLERGM